MGRAKNYLFFYSTIKCLRRFKRHLHFCMVLYALSYTESVYLVFVGGFYRCQMYYVPLKRPLHKTIGCGRVMDCERRRLETFDFYASLDLFTVISFFSFIYISIYTAIFDINITFQNHTKNNRNIHIYKLKIEY